MLEPYRGRVYDPCCGSSGIFVESVEFIRAHARGNGEGGRVKAGISIHSFWGTDAAAIGITNRDEPARW